MRRRKWESQLRKLFSEILPLPLGPDSVTADFESMFQALLARNSIVTAAPLIEHDGNSSV